VTDGVVRIVQLNAGTLLEPGWDERRHEVVAWIDRLAPDVVCLQEAWEAPGHANTAGWVAEHAAGTWYCAFGGAPFGPEVWPDSSLHFGPAVLSRWPVDDHALHRLPVPGDDPDRFLGGVPWALLHVRTAGLDVFSTHLASAPHQGYARVAQVVAIDDAVRAAAAGAAVVQGPVGCRRSAMPPIVCGDFNAEPDSDEIRFLSSLAVLEGRSTFYQDAWRVAGDGPGWTQDWRTNPIAAALNVHRKRIDYVFVGDPFQREGGAGRVLSAELAFHEPLTGVLASDHAGLVVEVAWPSRPPMPSSDG
jgi:endonuclease/exonuclease/phosphatase family metal-dependent hydrolase